MVAELVEVLVTVTEVAFATAPARFTGHPFPDLILCDILSYFGYGSRCLVSHYDGIFHFRVDTVVDLDITPTDSGDLDLYEDII